MLFRSPELLATIREHKPEVMFLLEARAYHLPPDCVPWLNVARQVLDGEFVGCGNSTRESLTIGLRGIRHPLCQQALTRLKGTDGSGGHGKT